MAPPQRQSSSSLNNFSTALVLTLLLLSIPIPALIRVLLYPPASAPPSMAGLALPALPKAVFNPALHRAILGFWFQGVPDNATSPAREAAMRWFGLANTPDAMAAFDAECKTLAGPALDLLGPAKFPLPAWQGYAQDRALAFGMTRPLRQVIHDDGDAADGLARADVARSLVLLLDQMPRNIFRSVREQGVVYAHYDRLARALLAALLAPPGEAGEYDVAGLDVARFRTSPVHRSWFYMPLMHSESAEDHDEYLRRVAGLRADVAGDEAAAEWADTSLKVEKEHRDLIDKFGRYPYRNEALGRESTPAEVEYLTKGGGAGSFGSSTNKGKDS